MSKFLGRLADHLLDEYGDDLGELCIVLPGRRAGLFLRKELAKRLDTAVRLPSFLPVNQFFEELSGLKQSDQTSLIFELYLVWKELKAENSESFETFLGWAETALKDFNEIDNYCVDPDNIFKNLKEIKEIEEWSLNSDELTIQQESYIQFWKELGDLYRAFQIKLDGEKLNYSGRIKRKLAENILNYLDQLPWKKVIIAGLNALSVSEQKVFFGLEKAGKAQFFWDIDRFYFDDENQEAGMFIREYAGKNPPGISDEFLQKTADIYVYGSASQIAQVKAVGEMIENGEIDSSASTAIVLADESLLVPLLHSLPEIKEGLNVSLGYPLRWSPISGLMDHVLNLHLKSAQNRRGKGQFYYKDFLAVINHAYISKYLDRLEVGLANEINRLILKHKLIFVSLDKLREKLPSWQSLDSIEFLFVSPGDVAQLVNILTNLIELLREEAVKNEDQLLNEYLFRYSRMLQKATEYLNSYPFASTIPVLVKLLRQLMASQSVPFYGEPLKGLQIMGMLETRAIDFDQVVLLGANEQLLPKPRFDHSFIPFDLKSSFGLPTYRQRDAIYAYYFYRLLTSPKKIDIFYTADSSGFGAGEKSRFIEQLDYHLNKANAAFSIQEKMLKSKLEDRSELVLQLPKNDAIFKRIDEHLAGGLSPTAINTLITCPLDYYFKYVAGIREADSMEEKVEASTFGSAIHDTLEDLYKPFLSKVLKAEYILEIRNNSDATLNKFFNEHYSAEELKYGSNRIAFEIAKAYIHRFLMWELNEIKRYQSEGRAITLLQVEKAYDLPIDLSEYGFDKEMRIKGKADRIDQIGDQFRVIDYKTGRVEQRHLSFSDPFKLASDSSKGKALQLMLYLWMFSKENKVNIDQVSAGIVSLHSISGGFLSLSKSAKAGGPMLKEEDLNNFFRGLATTLNELYEPATPFTHNAESKYCEFCD